MTLVGRKLQAVVAGTIDVGEDCAREAFSILNAGDRDAHLAVTVFYSHGIPAAALRFTLPARRTRRVFPGDAAFSGAIPRGTGYAGVVEADAPVVVWRTAARSRGTDPAWPFTVVFPVEG